MNRIRSFFAVLFFLALLPAWRLLDVVVFTWPVSLAYSFFLAVITLLCLCLPFKLLKPGSPNLFILALLALSLGAGLLTPPLSQQPIARPDLGHCGRATFTGVLRHFKFAMTGAMQDDLDLRNQLCWLRKLVGQTPGQFASDQALLDYHETLEMLLLKPELKYRASLPMIAILQGQVLSSIETSSPLVQALKGKRFIDSVRKWSERYTEEISQRNYHWWDWPYSAWIQFEYGFVERNWMKIVDSLKVEYP